MYQADRRGGRGLKIFFHIFFCQTVLLLTATKYFTNFMFASASFAFSEINFIIELFAFSACASVAVKFIISGWES